MSDGTKYMLGCICGTIAVILCIKYLGFLKSLIIIIVILAIFLGITYWLFK